MKKVSFQSLESLKSLFDTEKFVKKIIKMITYRSEFHK